MRNLDCQSAIPPAAGRRSLVLVLLAILALLGVAYLVLDHRPSLSRDIKYAHRARCADNLNRLGRALDRYAGANGGAYPGSLEALICGNVMQLRGADFCCSSTNASPLEHATTEELAANLASQGLPHDGAVNVDVPAPYLSYIYCAAGKRSTVSSSTVLMYEPLPNHEDGITVLFGDGQVNWLSKPAARALIAELNSGRNPPRGNQQ